MSNPVDASEIVTCEDLNSLINNFDKKIISSKEVIAKYSKELAILREQNKYYELKISENNLLNRGISLIKFGDVYDKSDNKNFIYPGINKKIESLNGYTSFKNTMISVFDTLKNTNILYTYPTFIKASDLFSLTIKGKDITLDYYTNEVEDLVLNFVITIPTFLTNVIYIPVPDYLPIEIRANKNVSSASTILLKEPEDVSDIYVTLTVPKEYIFENSNINLNYTHRYSLNITGIEICNLTTDRNCSIDFRINKYEKDFVINSLTFNENEGFGFEKYNNVAIYIAANEDDLLSNNFIDTIYVKNSETLNKTINEYVGREHAFFRIYIDAGNAPILIKNVKTIFKVR